MENILNQFRILRRKKIRGSLTVTAIIFVSLIMIFVVLQCVAFSSKMNSITEFTNAYLQQK